MFFCEDCKQYKDKIAKSIHNVDENLDPYEYTPRPYTCEFCHIKRCHAQGLLPQFNARGEVYTPYHYDPSWGVIENKKQYSIICKACFSNVNKTFNQKDLDRLFDRVERFVMQSGKIKDKARFLGNVEHCAKYLPYHCDSWQASFIKSLVDQIDQLPVEENFYDDSKYYEQWFKDAEKENSLDRWCKLFIPDNWDA